MNNYDVIIIGAGAAGLFCAAEAGKRKKTVLVIEHEEKVGKKILISGGGRCNFTNLYASPENYISQNPHFCKSALARYTQQDFIELVERYKIAYHEKKLGQLFCDSTSRQIVEMLLEECSKSDVHIKVNCSIKSVDKKNNFIIKTNLGDFKAGSLVIASGGLSIPKMGATPFGYKIAKQFGVKLTETKPALVPLLLSKEDLTKFKNLSGVSIDTIVSNNEISFRENILFTHKGLSGPAILQISSYLKDNEELKIDLIPDKNLDEIKNSKEKIELKTYLKNFFAERFTSVLNENFIPSKPLYQLNEKEIENVNHILKNFTLKPVGDEGYEKAEVTLGGVDTNELSSKTMMAKKAEGLFFIGEVVDVTGWLGGYNFQWAWSSGYACGTSL
ncbi:MAG: NAD(P)/FAD-dependent oxidoreductase [Ignavibacteria bacterium]|nr:NAD(P)/FAD-dependent oxidoreductase [Ignavibacteria bacterium]